MTSLDILFWLLVALLGGVIWAIEAGLTTRHRNTLLSSAVATLLTMLFIMFWIEDRSKLIPLDGPAQAAGKQAQPGQSANEDGGGGGNSGGGGGGGSKKSGSSNGSGQGQDGNARTAQRDNQSATPNAADIGKGDDLDPGKTVYSREPFKDCPLCPDIIIVPDGTSQLGSPASEANRDPNERVAEVIRVTKPFAIGRLEIVRGEFAAFAGETRYETRTQCDTDRRKGVFNWQRPAFEQDERHAVVCVSWADVRAYLDWLKAKTGRTYRLPSELEWEHAARAGTTTPHTTGETLERSMANVGRLRDGTTAGGLFAMNAWGLADTAGNAWEMTSHCLGEGGQISDTRVGLSDCRRLIKGGGWNSAPIAARPAARGSLNDGKATNFVGFRVVRDVDDRDSDKILSLPQRKGLLQAEKDAIEIKAKELEAEEAARRAARDAEEKKKNAPPAKK